MDDAIFDKFVTECEEEEKSGKDLVIKNKNQKTSTKNVTTVLKKLGNKLQKLATGADWSEDGNFGAMMNLMVIKTHLANLHQEERIDDVTISNIFENNWNWEDECGEIFKQKLNVFKDHRGNPFQEIETCDNTEEDATKNIRERVIEEMTTFYNKKVHT